jgi:hypothetical protein
MKRDMLTLMVESVGSNALHIKAIMSGKSEGTHRVNIKLIYMR